MNGIDLVALGLELAATANAYEAHTLAALDDPERGVRIDAHDDVRSCSDTNRHDPWHDVVRRWPRYSEREKARRGELHTTSRDELMTGAEVAVLVDGGSRVVVRYVATDGRWVVDESVSSVTTTI